MQDFSHQQHVSSIVFSTNNLGPPISSPKIMFKPSDANTFQTRWFQLVHVFFTTSMYALSLKNCQWKMLENCSPLHATNPNPQCCLTWLSIILGKNIRLHPQPFHFVGIGFALDPKFQRGNSHRATGLRSVTTVWTKTPGDAIAFAVGFLPRPLHKIKAGRTETSYCFRRQGVQTTNNTL